jgi:hypothetical protein
MLSVAERKLEPIVRMPSPSQPTLTSIINAASDSILAEYGNTDYTDGFREGMHAIISILGPYFMAGDPAMLALMLQERVRRRVVSKLDVSKLPKEG